MTPGNQDETLSFLAEHRLPYVCVDMPQGHRGSIPPVLAATAPGLAVVRLHGHSPSWAAATSTSGPAAAAPVPGWPGGRPRWPPWPAAPGRPTCCPATAAAATPRPAPSSSPPCSTPGHLDRACAPAGRQTAAGCRTKLDSQPQVGPHPLLADPDCVVCGLLARIPASSRVPPALPYHRGPPAGGRAESPVLPRPAAGDRHPAKMLIRPSCSTRLMALACGIAASPGSHHRPAQITQNRSERSPPAPPSVSWPPRPAGRRAVTSDSQTCPGNQLPAGRVPSRPYIHPPRPGPADVRFCR
jgi:hypothetical protein